MITYPVSERWKLFNRIQSFQITGPFCKFLLQNFGPLFRKSLKLPLNKSFHITEQREMCWHSIYAFEFPTPNHDAFTQELRH